MRYRRLSYRYAMLVENQPRPLGDQWRVERIGVVVAQPRWRPATDVYETQSAFTVICELAVVAQEDLEVQLFQDALVVEGRRRVPPPEGGGVYHSVEIRQGLFQTAVMFPRPIDEQAVEARFENGLLVVTLPKVGER